MTQQFSKLNKIGSTFKSNKIKQKINFTIGQKVKNETSSDSDDDYENSIFQPNISIESGTSHYVTDSSCDRSIEQGLEATEDNKLISSPKVDTFLPGVGIVMGNKSEMSNIGVLEKKQNLLNRVDSSQLDELQLSSVMNNISLTSDVTPTPEIRINSEISEASNTKKLPPNTLKLEKKFSRSSGEVDDQTDGTDKSLDRSSSHQDVQMSISQSQSESALKNIVSPLGSSTKELVFSPFSKFAKGVQNIGANLDPRKFSGQVRYVTEKEMEEHKKLQERWQNSKTRLIAL